MAHSPSARAHDDACFLCGSPQFTLHVLGTRRLLYCRRCVLGQLAPLPTEAELAALYASADYFRSADRVGYADYVADAAQHARSFRRQLAWLLARAPVRELLEIGCGPGLFLDEARRLGVAHVVGVDPNRWAAEQAHARGLDVRVGSIDVIPEIAAFDAIVMLDVLEHVVDPLPFLAAVRARLQPDGRLLVMTPDLRSLLARVSGRRWVSLKVPEHVRYYSRRGLDGVLRAAGFEVVAMRGAGQYVTVRFFLDRLERLAPRSARALRAVASACALLERVVFLTNGSIEVVARRAR